MRGVPRSSNPASGRTRTFPRAARGVSEYITDPYGQAVMATLPKHYWRFSDSDAGYGAHDWTGGRDGTYKGAFTLAQPSLLKSGKGDLSAVDIASTGYVDAKLFRATTATALSFGIWIHPDAVPFGGNGWMVAGVNAGILIFNFLSNGWVATLGATPANDTTGVIPLDRPTFCLVTWDTANIRVYRNGVLTAGPVSVGIGGSTGEHPIRFGAVDFAGAPVPNYDGRMDEATWWDRALSAAEVASLWAASGMATYGYLNQVTETNTATATTRNKARLVNQIAETDTAQPITKLKRKVLGQPIETDVAQSMTKLKLKSIGQATETDLAQIVRPAHSRIIVQVSETDVAQPMTRFKTKLIGQTVETDLAQVTTRRKVKIVSQINETDVAQTMTHKKLKVIGQPVETDIAQAMTKLKNKSLIQVAETNIAQAVTKLKRKTLGLPTETDLAQALTRRKLKVLGQPVETDLAQALTHRKVKIVNQIDETDTAQPIVRRKVRIVNQAVETNIAQAMVRLKVRIIAPTTETDLARAITKQHVKVIQQALETDIAELVSIPSRGRKQKMIL